MYISIQNHGFLPQDCCIVEKIDSLVVALIRQDAGLIQDLMPLGRTRNPTTTSLFIPLVLGATRSLAIAASQDRVRQHPPGDGTPTETSWSRGLWRVPENVGGTGLVLDCIFFPTYFFLGEPTRG